MISARVAQAVQANKSLSDEPRYKVGDVVMLNTHNRRREFQQKKDGRTAKLMPRFDGKYKVTAAYPEASIYTINMPNSTLTYTTFHAS